MALLYFGWKASVPGKVRPQPERRVRSEWWRILTWKLGKAYSLIRARDFLRFLLKACYYIPNPILNVQYFYLLCKSCEAPNAQTHPGFVIRLVNKEYLKWMCIENHRQEDFLARLTNQDVGLVADRKAQPMGYLWFSKSRQHYERRLEYIFDVGQGIYYYDAFTLPEYRGRGVWRELIKTLTDLCHQWARPKIYCLVDYCNRQSLQVHYHAGFKPKQRLLYLSLLGLKFHFFIRTATK